MADEQIALAAHLMRRAGVGATRDELEAIAARPYQDVVEELLTPDPAPGPNADLIDRYYPTSFSADTPVIWASCWIYDMASNKNPLPDKMALFWHHVFATGWFKSEHGPALIAQIETFRGNGLANLRQILLDLSRDPAMIHWLDNSENHAHAVNENYGRELLELFTMGIGTYTETDVKIAARAFTGWTFRQPIPLYPYGGYDSEFSYDPDDHDDSEKTFLGHSGNFNGEDIIDIIVQQEACARVLSRHLYNFFVADEPQIPAWSVTPPQDQAAEKAVVGYVYARGAEQVWGHALADLCEDAMALDPSFDLVKSNAALLDKHYLGARYPSGLPGGVPAEAYDEHDSARALAVAAEFLEFIDARLEAEGLGAPE
jgi:HEPN domain-containing protein